MSIARTIWAGSIAVLIAVASGCGGDSEQTSGTDASGSGGSPPTGSGTAGGGGEGAAPTTSSGGGMGGGMGGGGGFGPCMMADECDDGVFCNGVEECILNWCAAGTPPSCDDGASCTADACDTAANACANTPDDTACSDGAFCNGVETCDPVNGAAGTGCLTAGPACDDGISCTTDACDENSNACTNTPVDALCNNGAQCDGVEFCNALLGCMSTGGMSCDDNIPCTNDYCDLVADTCAHAPNDTLCSNGQFCDGVESCNPQLGCTPGQAPNCNDGVACTTDACNEANDTCTHAPNNALCGSFCSGAGTCDPIFGCVGGVPPNCNDGVACTIDGCSDIIQQCTHQSVNTACDDGLFCNGQETCGPGGCMQGFPVFCPSDGIPCTIDGCNEASDLCSYTPDSTQCPAGQICSVQQGGCVPPTPCTTGSQCQDGNLCNGVEVCINNGCYPGQPVLCNDNIGCTQDSCNPANGQCVYTPNDLACGDDGFACNGAQTCTLGVGCVPTPAVNCDDGVACTADQCNEPTGTCTHFAQDWLCDDSAICNGLEVCGANGCQPGAPFVCPDDGLACTTSVCNPMLNTCVSAPDNSTCPPGETCDPQTGACGFFCNIKECQGHVYACGDCIDNDGDGPIDDADASCLGPCDNTENSYYGGIPGQNNSPCKSDCYFDQDTGSGNDDCYWSHKCDPLEVPPNYPPEGSQCSYNPGASIPGYGGSCSEAFDMQSAECLAYCGPLTPNGCDCFGCCDIPGAPTTVWLGSENPSGTGSCNLNTVTNPALCKPCTQVDACLNTCAHCEICIGKPDLPPDCIVQTCPPGSQACGQPGQAPCAVGQTCITGCCQNNPG